MNLIFLMKRSKGSVIVESGETSLKKRFVKVYTPRKISNMIII